MEAFWEAAEAEYQAITGGVGVDPIQAALDQFEATYEPDINPTPIPEPFGNDSFSL